VCETLSVAELPAPDSSDGAASPPPPATLASTLALAPALDGVFTELATTAPLRGLPLEVELADALVHFDVAPGEFVGHGEQQLAAVAGACMRELLGEGSEGYELRWQLQADERHLMICAVPTALLLDVRVSAARFGLGLSQVQPQFPLRWNRHGKAMRSGLGVFTSGENEHAVIAFVRDGVVEALGTGSCPDELEDPLAPTPRVDRLLNNLGMEKYATPTRLDAQVDRMIASIGIDASQMQHFIAVDSSKAGPALSSRWMVYPGHGVRS
jgi:hypothetical protein